MIVGPSSSKQSFKSKVGIESSSHCLFWEEKMRLLIYEKVVGLKLDKFWGMIGKRKGSGESDGENLERMRSILSLKKLEEWLLASDCVSGVSGDELDGLRWRIEFKDFQSVRGLVDDSVTRFVRKLDLAFEIRDLTKLHWALNFLPSKGDFQRRHDRSNRLLSRSATRISGLIHGVWGLRSTIFDLSGAWKSSMELRVEESCSDRSEELEAGYVWRGEEKMSDSKYCQCQWFWKSGIEWQSVE